MFLQLFPELERSTSNIWIRRGATCSRTSPHMCYDVTPLHAITIYLIVINLNKRWYHSVRIRSLKTGHDHFCWALPFLGTKKSKKMFGCSSSVPVSSQLNRPSWIPLTHTYIYLHERGCHPHTFPKKVKCGHVDTCFFPICQSMIISSSFVFLSTVYFTILHVLDYAKLRRARLCETVLPYALLY